MKLSLFFCVAGLLSVAGIARAQVFRPDAVNGAVIGGLAGAVIGNNSGDLHHNGARGAVIGAVAGGLIGNAVGEERERTSYPAGRVAYRGYSGPRSSLSIGVGYGPGYWGSPYRHRSGPRYPLADYRFRPSYGYGYGYRYAVPVYSSYDDDYYEDGSSGALSGAFLGGIAGAIIGNNSGHRNGLQGAAIGAGAGLVLGSLADRSDRVRRLESERVYRENTPVAQAPAAPAVAPQNVTVINNYYGSNPAPMAAANGLFGR